MDIIRFVLANIVTAFDDITIGTKVTDGEAFGNFLEEAIQNHDVSTDHAPGQHFIHMPREAFGTVSCGVGRRHGPEGLGGGLRRWVRWNKGKKTSSTENAYVLREYRGRVSAFLQRDLAADVGSLAAIVYTREAYLADPDVVDKAGLSPEEAFRRQEERDRIGLSDCTHVLVAIIANAVGAPDGPPPVGPRRFAANLAGGNREALAWSADEIRDVAERVAAYDQNWCVVAD